MGTRKLSKLDLSSCRHQLVMSSSTRHNKTNIIISQLINIIIFIVYIIV